MAEPTTTITLGIVDSVMEVVLWGMNGGWSRLTPGAMRLARQMATAEAVFMAAGMVFARSEALQRMLFNGLKLGFFAILLLNLQPITVAFMNTIVWGGLQIGGNTQFTTAQFLTPSLILQLGVKHTQPLLTYVESIKGTWSSLTHLPAILLYSLMLQVAWFSYLTIALHVALAVIEFKLITVMGLLLIPWGILTHTAFMAEGILGGIVSSAVRLGTLAAVTSIFHKVLTHPALSLNAVITDQSWNTVLAMLALAFVMAVVSWAAPNYAAALCGTGPALTGTSLYRGAVLIGGMAAAGVRAGVRQVRGR